MDRYNLRLCPGQLKFAPEPRASNISRNLVSVVIPTWSRSAALANALDSVNAQTYANWEVIVVDDGSIDDTGEMVPELSNRDPRIRYIYQTNAGVSAVRNRGIALANFDLLVFLDSDDLWEPWTVAL